MWISDSGLHNSEGTHFSWFKPLDLQYFVTAALGNEYTTTRTVRSVLTFILS